MSEESSPIGDRASTTASDLDPRVVESLRAQLAGWRRALDGGAERVGWKIGLNIPEVQARLGIEEPVIGHLTSASRIESGGSYSASGATELHAETEVAVEVGADVDGAANEDAARAAIAGLAPAIELVDLDRPPDQLEPIVAANIFHRAVVLGPSRPAFPAEGVTARILVDGEERGTTEAPDDFAEVVLVTARLLAAAGERLQAGDRIIAGSIIPPVPVVRGQRVEVDLGGLGQVEVRVT